MNIQELVTPARVAALLTLVAPYTLSTFDGFRTLDVAVQVAIVSGITVVGIVFIAAYSYYITHKRVVETQVNATR